MKARDVWIMGFVMLGIIALYSWWEMENEEGDMVEGVVESIEEGWPAWTVWIGDKYVDIKGQYLYQNETYYPDDIGPLLEGKYVVIYFEEKGGRDVAVLIEGDNMTFERVEYDE
ncbi:MAG: hypothetical protein GXN92_03215 [Candidatus Micrarchaeota archaeon]|nr:hypothetical protein [Candidatus Micrarchaeota archaeon]